MVIRRRPSRLAAALLLAAAAHLAPAASALAQRGGLRGTLTDPDGQPLPGVRVSIVLADGGGRPVTVETNEDGRFTRAGLQVGMYRVTMERDGWEPLQAIVNISTGSQSFIEETLHPLPEGVLSPQEAQEAEAHLQAAQAAFESGDLEAAAAGFRAFTELAPTSAGAFFNLGATYERLQDYAQAVEAYEQAFALDSSMKDGLLAAADLYGRLERWNEALSAFDRVMDLVEGNAVNLYNYATFAVNAGRPDLALRFYEKAANADPALAVAHFQTGISKYQAADLDGAAVALTRYLDLEVTGAQADAALGVLATFRAEAAVPYYRRRLDANPGDAATLYQMASLQHQSGDLEGAGATFLEYLAAEPTGERSADALRLLEDDIPAAAAEYYEQQSAAAPDDADLYFKVGALKYRIEDFPGAVAALERHLELSPDSENAEAVRQLLTDARNRT